MYRKEKGRFVRRCIPVPQERGAIVQIQIRPCARTSTSGSPSAIGSKPYEAHEVRPMPASHVHRELRTSAVSKTITTTEMARAVTAAIFAKSPEPRITKKLRPAHIKAATIATVGKNDAKTTAKPAIDSAITEPIDLTILWRLFCRAVPGGDEGDIGYGPESRADSFLAAKRRIAIRAEHRDPHRASFSSPLSYLASMNRRCPCEHLRLPLNAGGWASGVKILIDSQSARPRWVST